MPEKIHLEATVLQIAWQIFDLSGHLFAPNKFVKWDPTLEVIQGHKLSKCTFFTICGLKWSMRVGSDFTNMISISVQKDGHLGQRFAMPSVKLWRLQMHFSGIWAWIQQNLSWARATLLCHYAFLKNGPLSLCSKSRCVLDWKSMFCFQRTGHSISIHNGFQFGIFLWETEAEFALRVPLSMYNVHIASAMRL